MNESIEHAKHIIKIKSLLMNIPDLMILNEMLLFQLTTE